MTGEAPAAAPDSARRNAPLWRRYAALGYEGLLLAAIVLLVGFLTLPALRHAGSGRPALVVPPPQSAPGNASPPPLIPAPPPK